MRLTLALPAALALTGCAVAPDRGTPTPAALQQQVTVGGVAYISDVALGAPGEMLTRAGAVPVPGMTVSVWRGAKAFGNGEGILAKTVAKAACEQQGGTHNPQAIGRFAGAGEWRFRGACA